MINTMQAINVSNLIQDLGSDFMYNDNSENDM